MTVAELPFTNLVERLDRDIKRRTRVAGSLPAKTAARTSSVRHWSPTTSPEQGSAATAPNAYVAC
jgi:hypothetical protein